MKSGLLLLFCLFLTIPAPGQSNIVREEVSIPLRDGIRLGAILFRPMKEGSYPALVYRTPYGAEDYAGAEFPRKAAAQGYLVLLVDVRGRYKSGGNFEAYRHEKEDGYDVIEWVATSPGCNGKVGTFGGSYPGMVQWQTLSLMPPHLTAAAPDMTPVGPHHFMYWGGAFSHPWIDWFTPYILADKRKKAGDHSGTWDDDTATKEWEAGNRKQWYDYRPLSELPLLKTHAPEYYQWLQHPDSSSWWNFLNAEGSFSRITSPVFVLSGWYDAAYGPEGARRGFNGIRQQSPSAAARSQTRLVIGPWNHTSLNAKKTRFGEIDFGPSAGFDHDADLLRWFDATLKGDSSRRIPRVSIFTMGANRWRFENEWPLSRAASTSYYLHSRGQAAADKSEGTLSIVRQASEPADAYRFDPKYPFWDVSYEKSYPYDQRANESRADVAVYTSEILTEDMEVTGELVAELYVSSSAPDTDFSFTLCDVYPDGRSINLHGLDAGYLRMRYRNGLANQELMTPGQIYCIRIRQVYTSNLFQKGHRMRVYVTSSKAPHYDPNPNTGKEIATEKNLVPATNRIYHDAKHPSRLILPVIKP